MTHLFEKKWFDESGYLLGSRYVTHGVFWFVYYVVFSLIWAKPDQSLFASFYLEFILLPARILAAYGVMYLLIPKYLLVKRFKAFLANYALVLVLAASIQSIVIVFFYDGLLAPVHPYGFSLSSWIKSLMLINSTVIFLSMLTILRAYLALKESIGEQTSADNSSEEKIEIVADRRTYLISVADILYVQGMGNYVEVFLKDNRKLTTYSSLKAFHERLPDSFSRVHKSYVVNTHYIESYNANDIIVAGAEVPRGREFDICNISNGD
ncbi:LytTR family transcriptional regulator [Alteromonadaceae bacterium M269]|nr:LytTR family transcriptional regulator [Alteromonadaceae bacterium M269]